MGRKSKLTKKLMEAIAMRVEKGDPPCTAAMLCGLPHQTHSQWLKYAEEDPEKASDDGTKFSAYSASIKKAEEQFKSQLIFMVFRAAPKDWKAAMTMLERRWPEEFGKRERHEITGPSGGPVTLAQCQTDKNWLKKRKALKEFYDLLPKDQQEALRDALRRINTGNSA
jgi:hypothetical protein